MNDKFTNIPFVNGQDDFKNSPENSRDSPCATIVNDGKMASTSSPKQSRRSVKKRVVSVPIRDVDGSRLKGEISAPPSDSWAWRKYGQKPIKGSPYPRGYYRCSSSKGCPARKQVERSRDDPKTLLVTYSCEHNHSWPASRNNHHNLSRQTAASATPTTNVTTLSKSEDDKIPTNISTQQQQNSNHNFHNLDETSLISGNEFVGWLSDFESTVLESPILESVTDAEINVFCSMGEEEESLFADLGELPECSTVFRRGMMVELEEERRRHSLARWCGTTS